MPRDLILGTAGHIDHGKTSLVRTLTGTDCDRLPEEKARGITIDIGFAALDLGEFRLGIVDVPGHERFVKNMLAGATGIDLALLVVAADDAVMPQTREHLEILQLLGLKAGIVALTKCDAVDAGNRELAVLDIADLVRGTFLEGAPVIPTSAVTGEGLDELRRVLVDACRAVELHATDEFFRLPIDRAFVVQGHGTVVTGSVASGSVNVGDELELLPDGVRVRVRSLQSHDSAADEVRRGQRAAVNLAGVSHDSIRRGQELATPGWLHPSRTLTVSVRTTADTRRPLRHRTPVRVHIGTAEVLGTLALLDSDAIPPGQSGLGQLFLAEAVATSWGQPFVLRESSATSTLGGGRVLQPVARKIRRKHLELVERVERLAGDDPLRRGMEVAYFCGTSGVTAVELARGVGIGPTAAASLLTQIRNRELCELRAGHGRAIAIHPESARDLETRVLGVVSRMHEQFPLLTTHDRAKVLAQLDYVGDDVLVAAVIDRLVVAKRLVGDSRRVARADFKPKLSVAQRKLKDKIVAAHAAAGFQPPEPADFANQAGGNSASLREIFDVAVAEGLLARIASDIHLHADAEADMRRRVGAGLVEGRGLTVAAIRDLLGTSRKFAVPLCEYLDRIGLTRRDGDLRFAAAKESAVAGE